MKPWVGSRSAASASVLPRCRSPMRWAAVICIACPSGIFLASRAASDGERRDRRFVAWHGTMATPSSFPARHRALPWRPGQRRHRAGIARPRRPRRGARQSPGARLPRMGGRRDVEITLPGRAFRNRPFRIGQARDGECRSARPRLQHQRQRHGARPRQRRSGDDQGLAGSGEADLGDLAMKQLTVNISGSGKVEAAPKDAADVRISGSGDVRLLSHPARLSSHVAGSGRITQASIDSAEEKTGASWVRAYGRRRNACVRSFSALRWPSRGYRPRRPIRHHSEPASRALRFRTPRRSMS